MPVLGSLQAGMMTDPCREGGGEGARKPGTRGWRHADRRRGSTQDGDTGARRTETQEHAERRHRSTQDGDTGARRTETRGHAERRHRSTQDGDTGARRTETQEHAGRKRGDTQDRDAGARRTETAGTRRRKWPATGKTAANQEAPLPYFVPEFSPLRTLQTKGPVAKTTGPSFNVRCGYSSAATGSSVAAADSHDEQSVHSPAGSAHAAGSTAAGSETAAGSPAGSSVTARNSASSVWSS